MSLACVTSLHRSKLWMPAHLDKLLPRPPPQRLQTIVSPGGVQLVRKLAGLVSIKGAGPPPSCSFGTAGQIPAASRFASFRSLAMAHHRRVDLDRQPRAHQCAGASCGIYNHSLVGTRRRIHSARFVHLTDSLVCLHAVSRGRSSSTKNEKDPSKIEQLPP